MNPVISSAAAGGLSLLLATSLTSQAATHQQAGIFATSGGITNDIQGVIRTVADATTMRVPAEEYIAIFPRFEYVGFCAGGAGALDQYNIESVDIVIEDQDDGNAGSGVENQFTVTFYSEDTAATMNATVAPDLTSRQTVGPFVMPNNGTPGQAMGYWFNIALPTGGVNVQRTVTGGIDGSVFCGVALNEEAAGNTITMPFLSGADLSSVGLAEFDLCNNGSDPRSTANAAGHGLTGALGPATSCSGGYAYLDDPATAGIDFFGPYSLFIALLHEDATFKTLVRTDQDAGVTAGGNMPSSNVAPGSMTQFSSRRPVGASEVSDCSGTSTRIDDLHFYYRDSRLKNTPSPVQIFFAFGPPATAATDLDLVGWDGMVCFPPNTILGLTTGVTDANGEFTSGAGAGGMPLSMQPIGLRLTVTVTAIGLITNQDGSIALSAAPCERLIL